MLSLVCVILDRNLRTGNRSTAKCMIETSLGHTVSTDGGASALPAAPRSRQCHLPHSLLLPRNPRPADGTTQPPSQPGQRCQHLLETFSALFFKESWCESVELKERGEDGEPVRRAKFLRGGEVPHGACKHSEGRRTNHSRRLSSGSPSRSPSGRSRPPPEAPPPAGMWREGRQREGGRVE